MAGKKYGCEQESPEYKISVFWQNKAKEARGMKGIGKGAVGVGWVVAVYLLAAIFFYPLTLCLRAEEGKLCLYWLPRLFGGYAAPQRLPIKQLVRLGTRERRRGHGIKRLRRLWRVASALRLRKLWFDFLFLRPGSRRFDGECIISFSLCDIMLKSLRRWRHRIRRGKHGRRA